MILIGIDPGKKGAYAVIDTDDGVRVKAWEDEVFVQDMFALSPVEDGQALAVVERVGAMPGQGVTSCFSFGKSAGFIEGVLRAYSIPYELVSVDVECSIVVGGKRVVKKNQVGVMNAIDKVVATRVAETILVQDIAILVVANPDLNGVESAGIFAYDNGF